MSRPRSNNQPGASRRSGGAIGAAALVAAFLLAWPVLADRDPAADAKDGGEALASADAKAKDKAESEIEASPQPPKSLLVGDRAYADGFLQDALRHYSSYRDELAADDSGGHLLAARRLAATHLELGQTRQARQVIEDIEKRFPETKSLENRVVIAESLLIEGKPRETREVLTQALRNFPAEGEPHHRALATLGHAQALMDEWEAAVKVYATLRKAGEGGIWEFIALRQILLILIAQNQLDEARRELAGFKPGNEISKQIKDDVAKLEFYLLVSGDELPAAKEAFEKIKSGGVDKRDHFWNTAIAKFAARLGEAGYIDDALAALRHGVATAPDRDGRQRAMTALFKALVKFERFDQAEEVARQFAEFYAGDEEAFEIMLALAAVFEKRGRAGEAIKIYDEVVANSSSLRNRAQAARRAARALIAAKEFDEAERHCRYLVENAEDDNERGEGLFLLAEIAAASQQPREAAVQFLRLAESHPSWRERALARAMRLFIAIGEHAKAIAAADLIVAEFADSTAICDIRFLRAVALEKSGDREAALRQLLEFVEQCGKNSNVPAALLLAGDIAYEQLDFESALHSYSRLIEGHSTSDNVPRALHRRALCHFFLGSDDLAAKDVELLKRLFPKSPETVNAMLWLADFHRENNQFELAEKTLAETAAMAPDEKTASQITYELAYVNFRAGKDEEALKLAGTIVEKYSSQEVAADALYLVGDTLSRAGKFKEAIAAYALAAEARPGSPLEIACWGRIGDCYFAKFPDKYDDQMLAKAIEYYHKVLAEPRIIDIFRKQSIFKIGKCHELKGDADAAAAKFRQLLYEFPDGRGGRGHAETVWLVKAAMALADLYILENTPEGAIKALEVFQILIDNDIEPVNSHRERIAALRGKYGL